MTNEEIVELLPRIKSVACRIATNGCDPDDLVQQAVYKLMTRKVVADYPIVTAVSVMKDFCLTHGYHPCSKRLTRRGSSYTETVNKDYKNYEVDWEGIPFTATELDIVQLYCEEGWTKEDIAKLYECSAMHVLRTLRRAAIKAGIAWGLINKDTGEIE